MGKLISIWEFICRRKYLITIVAFAVIIVFLDENSLLRRLGYEREISQLKEEIEKYRADYEENTKRLNEISTNPDAIEQIALLQNFSLYPLLLITFLCTFASKAKIEKIPDMENYIVSARKYRPSTFESVVGQRALTTTLKNAIATQKLAHAYLFCGPRGVGKTTCARIFAKTINCMTPTADGEACNQCESCVAFNALIRLKS